MSISRLVSLKFFLRMQPSVFHHLSYLIVPRGHTQVKNNLLISISSHIKPKLDDLNFGHTKWQN
jgi:hypothetical protein